MLKNQKQRNICEKNYKKKIVTNLRFFLIGSSSDLTPTSVKLEELSA